MTDLAPKPKHGVNRARRAAFAFCVTFLGMSMVFALALLQTPVQSVTEAAVKVLGDIAILIGMAYIGGSVVDYSGMFTAIGQRFGVKIPTQKDTDDSKDGDGK